MPHRKILLGAALANIQPLSICARTLYLIWHMSAKILICARKRVGAQLSGKICFKKVKIAYNQQPLGICALGTCYVLRSTQVT